MENSSIHAELTEVQTYFSVSTCPTDQGITSRGVGRQFSRICSSLWKQKEGQTSYRGKKKKDSMSVRALGSSPTTQLRVLCWWQSHEEGRAHLLSLTAGGGSVRACGEQMNRSQEHGLVCGKKRDRFKILNLRMALCLPLTEQINTISNALAVYAPKPTNFTLSYLFQNHHCCPDHCFPFRACCGKLSLLLLSPSQEDSCQESELLFP